MRTSDTSQQPRGDCRFRAERIKMPWEIVSNADKMLTMVNEKKRATLTEVAQGLGIDKAGAEELAKILDRQGLIKLVYPANPFMEPYLEAV